MNTLMCNDFEEEHFSVRRKEISYYYRSFILGALPYKKTTDHEISRRYGNVYYSVIRGTDIYNQVIPYGNMARLLLHYICDQAKRSDDGVIVFGNSLSEFLKRLGLPTGGSTMIRAKEQLSNIFGSQFLIGQENEGLRYEEGFKVVDSIQMEWNVDCFRSLKHFQYPEKNALLLGKDFLRRLKADGETYPLDINVIRKIKQSSLAIDIYSWWTYKAASSVNWNKAQKISWDSLYTQFGSNQSLTSPRKARFKQWFMETVDFLKENNINVSNLVSSEDNLLFYPTDPDIARKKLL